MKRLIESWLWTLVVMWALTPSAQAATTNWNSNSSGNFNDPTKWTAGAPTMAVTAELNRGSGVTYTVTIPGHLSFVPAVNYASDRLIVGGNTVTLADGTNPLLETDDTYAVKNTSLDESLRGIIIGQSVFDQAVLTVSLNTFQGVAATIGDNSSVGTLNINGGTLTTLTLTGSSASAHELIIGRTGSGHLNVSEGAMLLLSGFEGDSALGLTSFGFGTAMVDGAMSTWINAAELYVGFAGSGSLTVQAGGTVANRDGIIANSAGSSGGVTVTGAGSSWVNNGTLRVGLDGNNAELHVEAGGSVMSQQALVAESASHFGSVTVTGTDSNWDTNGNSLSIGVAGTGTLLIEAGGSVSTGGGSVLSNIGDATGSQGTVTVTGAGSSWTNVGILSVGSPSVGTAGTGMLNVSNGASVLNDFGALVVGNSGAGTLTIQSGGGVSADSGTLGNTAGTQGMATVTGAGSTWTNRDVLLIGVQGHGELHVSAGGRVDDGYAAIGAQGGGTGLVEVSGAGSVWNQTNNFDVGAYLGTINGVDVIGFGTLNVIAGGHVNTGTDAAITGSTSKTTVDGSGSVWNVGDELSMDFAATLEVTSGGVVNSRAAFVGGFKDGAATVNGVGTTWNVADILSVGRTGTGTLNVTGGGHLTSRLAYLGVRSSDSTASNAVVQIDGVGSSLTSTEQLFVGYEGDASMLVSGGAHVTSGTGQVGFVAPAEGSVHIKGPGSNWTCNESLYVGVAGTGNVLVSDGGSVVVDDLLSIGPRGAVEGNSLVEADVRNGGTVSPGLSTGFLPSDALGTLQLDGDYTQTAAGALQIQLASISGFDKVAVTGHAALGGKLKLSLLGGFMPAVGDMFQVFTATDGITGTFDLEFTSLSSGTGNGFIVVYSDSDVVLRFVEFLPGDYNHNGIVDAADYTVWRDSLGSTTDLRANGDNTGASAGVVDQADYNIWIANFGMSAGSGANSYSTAAVPEPTTLLLLLPGILTMCSRPRATVS